MSEDDTSSMPPDDLELEEWIDREADRFERAWKQSPRPDIAGFLADSEGRRRWLLLCELLRIDLEHRFRGGESARIEDYLDSFPELSSAGAGLPDELVMFAKTLAQKHEPSDNLREQLANAGSDQEQVRFLVCPHCDQPVEIKLSGASGSAVCPKCAGAIEFEFPELAPGAKLRLPRTLGKFQLLEFVGGGSFGTVFKARDSELGRIVAIKFPRTGALENSSDEKRFFKEAQATAALRHPNIVQLHEVGREEGVPYIVSDFVEGKTLADRLEERTHSQRECLDWMCAIADALHYAHTHDVIHRDVKPSNILIDETGHPFVTDFGLARRLSDRVHMTIDGQILGTPAYMSPEQAAGTSSAVDARSDVFSLGVMLYEMLAGERPFRGNVRMLLQQLIERDPRPLRDLNDRIPRDLQTICFKALAKSPGRRYQDAKQFADDLRRFMNHEPIHARPVGRIERAWQWCRRNQRLAITYAAATVTVVTVTVIAFVLINGARQTAVQERNNAQTLADNLAVSLKTSERLRQAEAAARKNAERQTRIANSNRLVVQSQAESNDDASLRLAIEAVEATYGDDGEVVPAAHQNLRDALGKIHGWPLSPEQPVTATAYGPDRLWLATGHKDGSVRIWDLDADDPTANPRTLRGLDGEVSHLAVSPDGRRVVAAGEQGLMAWQIDKGGLAELGVALASGDHSFQSLVFGPQSNRLATAGWGDQVHVWNLAATPPEKLDVTVPNKVPELQVETEISPDGRWLLTRNTEYVIDGPLATVARLFDLEAKSGVDKPIQLTEYDDGMREARFDVSGRWVAALSSEKLWLWDLNAASPRESRRQFWSGEQPLRAIAFDPQGRWLLVSRYAGQSLLLDLSTDDPPQHQWELHLKDEAAKFSPDGKHLACSREAELKLWKLDDFQSEPIDIPCLGVRVKRIGFTHDSHWLACEWEDGAIRKYPLAADDPLADAVPVSNWDGLPFVARRPRWSVTEGDVPRLIDADNPDAVDAIVLRGHMAIPGGGLFGAGPIFEMEVSGDVTTIAIDDLGRRAVTAGDDHTVRLWDLTSVNPSRSSLVLQNENTQGIAALSADGGWAVTGSPQQNEALLWNLTNGDKPMSVVLRGHENVVTHALFTPDSKHVITADRDGVLRIWDCQSADEAESRVLAEGSDWTRSLTIDNQGRRVAAGHGDGSVTVVTLDVNGGDSSEKSFNADEAAIWSVLFNHDGTELWTGSDNGRLTQWKLTDEGDAKRGVTREQSGPIRGIVADPRGAWIATSGLSQTVRWWDLTKTDANVKPVELFGTSVVVDPSGRWLVCDNQIWDLAGQQPFKTPVVLRGHDDSISCLAVGGSGRLLATGSKDTTIRIRPFTIDDLLTQARRAAP